MTSERYYISTGRVPATGVMTMLTGGIFASAILGFLVALINFWLGYIIVTLVVTLAYGAGVGAAVRYSAKIAHVRHPGFTRFVAAIIGLFAVYLAWAWWFWVHSQQFFPVRPNWNVWQQVQLFYGIVTSPGDMICNHAEIRGQWALGRF